MSQQQESKTQTPIHHDANHHNVNNATATLLSLTPRGLEGVVQEIILKQSPPSSVLVDCFGETEAHCLNRAKQAQTLLRKSPSNKTTKRQHQQKQKENKHISWYEHPVGTIAFPLHQSAHNDDDTKTPTATSHHTKEEEHVSVGYNREGRPTWSMAGVWSGSVWLRIRTSSFDGLEHLSKLRCLGPLIAVGASSSTTSSRGDPSSGVLHLHDSLEDAAHSIVTWVNHPDTKYAAGMQQAFRVWKQWVQWVWSPLLSPSQYQALQDRIRTNRLRYRVSCVRDDTSTTSAPTKSKKRKPGSSSSSSYAYARHELIPSVMNQCELLPPDCNDENQWTVDLTQYDVEVVLILQASSVERRKGSSHSIAVGIALSPYSFLSAKSFGSGGIPADTTPPILMGHHQLDTVIRLRPTTAHILGHLAPLKDTDVVLDPCAGIGTIPWEVDATGRCDNQRGRLACIGLGGDVTLNQPHMMTAATAFAQTGADAEQTSTAKNANDLQPPCSLLAAWDATHLPIRTSSIDVVISDLPFGQKCLSRHALSQLLPLILRECARVLIPNNQGRMILLCGSPSAIIDGIEELSEDYWRRPMDMVLPVSIGGILAWVVSVRRNDTIYTVGECETDRLGRVRKVTGKRDRTGRQVQSSYGKAKTASTTLT